MRGGNKFTQPPEAWPRIVQADGRGKGGVGEVAKAINEIPLESTQTGDDENSEISNLSDARPRDPRHCDSILIIQGGKTVYLRIQRGTPNVSDTFWRQASVTFILIVH